MDITANVISQSLVMTSEIVGALTDLVQERTDIETYVMMMGSDYSADHLKEQFRVPILPVDSESMEPNGDEFEVVVSFADVADRIQRFRGGGMLQ